MNPALCGAVESEFRSRFSRDAEVVAFAPGRVEILGNHTDYNGGFVMPVGLDLGVVAAAGKRSGRCVEIHTATLGEGIEFDLDRIERDPARRWADYPKGVLRELLASGVPVGGFSLAIASDLPFGAGVSSSAALELAVAEACYGLFGGRPRDLMDEALLCQRAEAGFVGMPCGVLDQFASRFAKEDCALFLDCTTLEWKRLPLGRSDLALVLADTRVKHALVDGKYAELRRSCERAAARLGEGLGRPVRTLRDVSMEDFTRLSGALFPEDRRRVEHVLRENERVLDGKTQLEAGKPESLGPLMVASHSSSRDLFGNSCPELDVLVEEAQKLPGFIGGKLSGGGFGGCTVNLVEAAAADDFSRSLADRYQARTGSEPRMIRAGIGGGARLERSLKAS